MNDSQPSQLGKTTMSAASRYWRIIRIDAAGRRKIEEISPAKVFFLASFPEFTPTSEVADAVVQPQLLHWMKEGDGKYIDRSVCQDIETRNDPTVTANDCPEGRTRYRATITNKADGRTTKEPFQSDDNISWLAKLCLKCFISSQIDRVCQQLGVQFGKTHGFTYNDLLPFVLDEDNSRNQREKNTSYQSFPDDILHSFNPSQSSLATWTTRRVKHNKEINAFLLEHGVYLVSDWAILNDTTPKQLERIFAKVYQLTTVEIQDAKLILESYHSVYRVQRLQQRQAGIKGTCLPPTAAQLQQMVQHLSSKTNISPVTILTKLQNIASRLREYRIFVRGGSIPKEESDLIRLAQNIPDPNSEIVDETSEFLRVYRQEFLKCLDQSIAKVTNDRLQTIASKDRQKAQKFIIALQLFHCQNLSMSEIAKVIDMKAQFQVSRLLKLKEFRTDVQQQLLILLRDRVFHQAKLYTEPQHLETFHNQIEEAINEQIANAIQEAATEASTARTEKHHNSTSLFSERLCHYLDIRSKCHD